MAPKRKQTPKNGFYYFMLEVKDRGGSQYKSMKDAADAAGPMWEKLSAKEREPYLQQALMSRNAVRGVKLTCDGKDMEELQREQEQEQIWLEEMKKHINLTLKLAQKKNCIQEEMFFIIHINIFCHVKSSFPVPVDKLYPAEIGVAAFTLEDGVLPDRVYHRIIKPGALPLGFAGEAKLHSNKTHQLSPPLPGQTENNMEEVFTELKSFLRRYSPTKGYPVLYADERRMKRFQHVLDDWCYDFGEERSLFKVYNLEYMFHVLRNSVSNDDQVWPSDTYSSREIDKDVYAYATDISCDFHEVSNVSNHCSRSIAVRYAFIICDNCCGDLKINLVAGQHIPKKSGFSSAKTRSIASSSSFQSAAPSEIDDDTQSLISVSSKASWGNLSTNTQSSAFTLDSESTFPKLGSEKRRQARAREQGYNNMDSDSDVSSQLSFASALGSSSMKNNEVNAFVSDFKKFNLNDDEGGLDGDFPSIGHSRGRGIKKNANWGPNLRGIPSASRGRGYGN